MAAAGPPLAVVVAPQPPITALAVLGLLTALGGLALLALVAARTRVRRPLVAPPSMDVPDPAATAAVVNLLVSDFVVSEEAVPATVIDLAAKGWLDIESYDVGRQVVVRVPRRAGHGLLQPHEQRVLDHVRQVAVDGVVPAGALSTGPADQSTRWWRGFRSEVVADASKRGLCRRRWPVRAPALGTLMLMASLALDWAAGRFHDAKDLRFTPLLWAAVGAAGLLALVVTRIGSSDRQRDTDEGRVEAGRWLALRHYLADNGSFALAPAGSVVIWDQYLAYAAAMGLARQAVNELPLGAESDHQAWSSYGGRWRLVHVRYPHVRPGWGRHPLAALTLGLIGAALAAAILRLALFVHSDPLTGIGSIGGSHARSVHIVHLAATIVTLLVVIPLAWSAVQIACAVIDLVTTRAVTGVVLRHRLRPRAMPLAPKALRWSIDRAYASRAERSRWFVAVDDGTADSVNAWSVGAAVYDKVQQGQRVQAVVTRMLGHVRSIEVLDGEVPGSSAVADKVDVDASADPALLASARRLSESRSA